MSQISDSSNNSDNDSIYLSSEDESDVVFLRNKVSELFKEKKALEFKYDKLNKNFISSDFSSIKIEPVEIVSANLCCGFSKSIRPFKKNNDSLSNPKDPFDKLVELVDLIDKIKNKLVELNDLSLNYESIINSKYQDKDDLIFYKAMISDSKKFFVPSFRIRKKKIVNDINKILMMFNYHDIRYVNYIDINTIKILKDVYTRLILEIQDSSKKNTSRWIKENKVKCAETIKLEMERTFNYHFDVNSHFFEIISKEVAFYSISKF